ncbi:fucolectin-6-like isoform X2 [Ranitomeya imitator]
MNLLSSLILLTSVVLTRGCAPAPGATNIARNGEASQISDYQYPLATYAKNAIDGISNTEFSKGSCTHTNYDKDPWWKLDLKQNYKILNVVLTNRMDCCPERLIGAEVRIGNSPDNNNPVCDKVKSVASATLSFCCKGMEGRYVSVVIPGRSEYLTLCEVEVYGDVINKENKVCW